MKKILKSIMLTLLWFLLATMVCIAVRGIVYILGLLIGETMSVLLITILLLIFIAIFIYKEFFGKEVKCYCFRKMFVYVHNYVAYSFVF